MTCALSIYMMALEASFDGTSLIEGTLPNSEIAQRIKEAMEPLWDDAVPPSTLFTRCRGIL